MSTISLTLPSDGQTIDASDVNNPLNTIAAEINGNLDNSNIKAGAAIERSKIAGFTDGWEALGYAPSTVTANGNRSYDLTISSVDITGNVSPGMRLKLTRTVTAPTGSITLNGTTQYLSKSSPSGMTFTDDFTVSAWVKLSSYSGGGIASRYDGTSGWLLWHSNGQIILQGVNGAAANYNRVRSYQSIPLNKWVHVTAQLDMSSSDVTTGTFNYIMIDGVSVPCYKETAGTAPATLAQAGNLEIGSWNGGTNLLAGQIAQVAIYSAKVTQATIKASMNQTLTGSETNLVSAFKLDQASGLNDLSANANNLTAQGSPSYSTTATPFTQDVTGTSVTAGTTNYAIITKASFSTNTTLTVQVPEGDTIPTSGGVSAVSYSTQKVPYAFPAQRGKWAVESILKAQRTLGTTASTYYESLNLTIPVGSWAARYYSIHYIQDTATGYHDPNSTLSTSSSAETDAYWTDGLASGVLGGADTARYTHGRHGYIDTTTATLYYLLLQNANNAPASQIAIFGSILVEPAYL